MKKTNTWFVALLGLSLLGSSCSKFLDVQPTGTLIEEKQFEDLSGFTDALYGVYGKMASPELYGENLSWGFADKLGQITARIEEGHVDYDIIRYNYDNKNVRSLSDQVWEELYKAISYANNLIQHCETTNISSPDIAWIKAEAIASRAYMHFDLIRLYCPDIRSEAEAGGIPYSYSFDLKSKKVFTLKESYDNVLRDLDEAERLLAEDKEVKPERVWTESLRNGRVAHLNQYAIKALKARVYHAMGRKDEAARYAREVIESGMFKLSDASNFASVRRFPMEGELIFGLHNVGLSDLLATKFHPAVKSPGEFTEVNRSLKSLFNTSKFTASSSDARYTSFYQEVVGRGLFSFTRLIASQEEAQKNSTKLQGLCLIRLPEMYYILIESLFESNKEESRRLLNTLRASRGLANIEDTSFATADALKKELRDERLREFPGEGQAFFALKYYMLPFRSVRNEEIRPKAETFVLPWPERELEYGNTIIKN